VGIPAARLARSSRRGGTTSHASSPSPPIFDNRRLDAPHRVSPMTGSLDPVDVARDIASVPQITSPRRDEMSARHHRALSPRVGNDDRMSLITLPLHA